MHSFQRWIFKDPVNDSCSKKLGKLFKNIDLPFYIYLLSFSKFELNHDAISLLVSLCVAVLNLV